MMSYDRFGAGPPLLLIHGDAWDGSPDVLTALDATAFAATDDLCGTRRSFMPLLIAAAP
jgi:hypothetical protein